MDNNVTSNTQEGQDRALQILKYTRQNKLANLPAIFAITCLVIIFIMFFSIFYGKNNNHKANQLKTSNSTTTIVKKDFNFGIKSSEPSSNKNFAKIKEYDLSPKKQIFKKYQAIPVNKDEIPDNASTTPVEKKDVDTENIVVAKAIKINPNFLIQEGTYIPCSLMTRFVSEVAGRIQCMIAEDIYSANGLVKLIEKGTKAIGEYKSGTLNHGVGRMFVIWTKLITADFKQISLINTPVVGQLGEAGISGQIDSHFLQRFGGALMLSIVQDVAKSLTTRKEGKSNVVNVYQTDHSRDALVAMAEKTLDNSINIPPTMYKKQGEIIGILVGTDIDFSKVYKLQVNNAIN